MSSFTIIGGSGFIGRHVAAALRDTGQPVSTPSRDVPIDTLDRPGHVIYCAGLTADFRNRPHDTMEAHVELLNRVLRQGGFESLLYLSSTRVYDGAAEGREDMKLSVDPSSPSDLYNLSKLAGEALCLNHDNPKVRVARLSNVYGADMFTNDVALQNFLTSIILQAVVEAHVLLQTASGSAKDYVHIDDVVRALILIATNGADRLYNIASGDNVSHRQILDRLSGITGGTWSTATDAPQTGFPKISTQRIATAFANAGSHWAPANVLDLLPDLIHAASRGNSLTVGAVA